MKTFPIAKRMQAIQPFHVMHLLARAKELEAQGRDIVHMEIGEPDFVTPEPILSAAQKAIQEGKTHYTPALGLPLLRETIANYYSSEFSIDVDASQIIITPGASGALSLLTGVLIDPNDEVIMSDPGYPCNRHFVRLMEGRPVTIPVDKSCDFQLTVDLIDQHWNSNSKMVMLATPSNPTGTVISRHSLEQIVRYVAANNGYVLVDEIYQGLVYDGEIYSAANMSDNVCVINSFSKYFSMTGWRLGWIVAPKELVGNLDKLAQNIFLAAPTLAQYAALAAFEEDARTILNQRRDEYKNRRDYLLRALQEIGFKIPCPPQGAFYIYADCSAFTHDSYDFCQSLLEKVGVAVTPGLDFGSNAPEKYVRFAYTTSMQQVEEGIKRLNSYLRK